MKTRTSIQNLYPHQEDDIESLFAQISNPNIRRVVYQLPTGGGKTVVFAEIAKRFTDQYHNGVIVLTHRSELCKQTSSTLKKMGVAHKIINSTNSRIDPNCSCYVAMVETLRNRIKSKKITVGNVGLVIIDEAHHNSFRKLLGSYKNAFVIGVTATPFSSDISKPMKQHYQTLVMGQNIATLIDEGFLAKADSVVHEVELNTLKTGVNGDYTVSSSNELYGAPAMLDLLLKTYQENASGKKTLIFNNGIETSHKVKELFEKAGIAIRHLDHKTLEAERMEILQWFKKTKGAVLSSVSLLTTGFDEPTIQTVILYRATTSITLYHQMIGRGSRRLPTKKSFTVIDLGNNMQRFGNWENPVDWQFVFDNPEAFAQQLHYNATSHNSIQLHAISAELRAQFPNTLELTFDIQAQYEEALNNDEKPKSVIRQSIRQHALMCLENCESMSHALSLAKMLAPEIEWRVKQYVKCLDRASKNYKDWLIEDYQQTLQSLIKKLYARKNPVAA